MRDVAYACRRRGCKQSPATLHWSCNGSRSMSCSKSDSQDNILLLTETPCDLAACTRSCHPKGGAKAVCDWTRASQQGQGRKTNENQLKWTRQYSGTWPSLLDRFLTSLILHGQDPLAPAGLAVGLAQSRGAKQMDRPGHIMALMNKLLV